MGGSRFDPCGKPSYHEMRYIPGCTCLRIRPHGGLLRPNGKRAGGLHPGNEWTAARTSAFGSSQNCRLLARTLRPEGTTLSSTDTLEKNPHPEAAETATPEVNDGHEGHPHEHDGHDHDHAHQHGPVLNPDCTQELVLDIPVEEVAKAYRSVTGNYRKYAKIPGFRAGKVPESVVKRRYAAEIRKDVIDALLPERFNKAVSELGVRPVGQPQVTELNVEDGAPLHVKAVFEFVPAFSIEGYKDVTVPKPPVEITEEEFQAELAQLRESRATIEPVEEDRPLRDGDWAQITYKGLIEGDESAAPVAGEDTLVEIGGKDTVEAFSTALKGAKPGQELKAEVIYPADYAEAKLAGKTVAYDVEVKAIKKRTLPELDDDFARELGAYESFADLEETVGVKRQLRSPGRQLAPVANPKQASKAAFHNGVDQRGEPKVVIPLKESANHLIVLRQRGEAVLHTRSLPRRESIGMAPFPGDALGPGFNSRVFPFFAGLARTHRHRTRCRREEKP